MTKFTRGVFEVILCLSPAPCFQSSQRELPKKSSKHSQACESINSGRASRYGSEGQEEGGCVLPASTALDVMRGLLSPARLFS